MIEIENIEKVYLLGVGGIGMSALARYFHFIGKQVSGYDRTVSSLTLDLENEGMPVHYNADLNQVPKISDINKTLIIYTPAVPSDFPELCYFRENGFAIYKRSQVVGLQYDKTNHLLMHAMGPNVAGVIGSAVAAGVLLSFLY